MTEKKITNLRLNHAGTDGYLPQFIQDTKEIERTDLLVIRLRLYLEFMMTKLIEKKMDGLESVENKYESYSDKFKILNQLYNVEAEANTNLAKINEIRNKFAHNWDIENAWEKSEEKIDDLKHIEDGAFEGASFNEPRDELIARTFSTFFKLADMNPKALSQIGEIEGFYASWDEI